VSPIESLDLIFYLRKVSELQRITSYLSLVTEFAVRIGSESCRESGLDALFEKNF
jgi:hypothetical protein